MAKIIAVHSFKGGTGKTTLSANIAVQLANEGYNVMTMDLDLNGPGLHVMFNINREKIKFTLNDTLLKRCSPTDPVIDISSQYNIDKGTLSFIPASSDTEDILKILNTGYELKTFRDALNSITEQFLVDYVVIDTHPGIDEATLLAIASCDLIFIVSKLDNQDIFGTRVLLEVSKALSKDTFLISNLIPPGIDPVQTKEKLSNLFEIPVLAAIPFHSDIMRELSKNVFVHKYPNHEFTKTISSIIDTLK